MAALQLLALNGPLAGDLGPPEAVLTLLDRAALGAAGVDELTAWLLRAVEEEAGAMFERFTSRARRAVVLAQEEARGLGHAHIGTEHLLLGLVREGEGVGAQVLDALGADARSVRQQVLQLLASPAHLGGGLEDRDDDEDLESETIAVVGGLFVENRRLRAEVRRLRELLRRHGVEPDGGESRTA